MGWPGGVLPKGFLARRGPPAPIAGAPLRGDDPRRRRPDITRAKQLLGWTPRTSLDVGLKSTIAWFSDERADAAKGTRPHPVLNTAVSVG